MKPMTDNQKDSRALQLLMDALPEEVYQRAAEHYIAAREAGTSIIPDFADGIETAFDVLIVGFDWDHTEEGYMFWASTADLLCDYPVPREALEPFITARDKLFIGALYDHCLRSNVKGES